MLLFHELGHYVAMRAFGYADARIFFLPLLGALTTSRASTAHPWQRALILLAGPVPGILLGALLMTATAHSWLAVGKLLISINLVNLLPLAALDGGRLLATLVPPRRGKLEIAVALVATLGAVLWLLASRRFVWASGLACTLMLLPLRLRVASSAAALTGEYPITIERCSPRQQIELFRVALAFGGPTPRRTPKGVASWMRTIHERYLDSRLSNLARAGVALVYLGSLALGSALLLR